MASGSIAPKAEEESHANATAEVRVEAEARLGAAAMNVIEEPSAPVAAGPGAQIPVQAIGAAGPVQNLAAAVREDAAQADAARAEAEVARLFRESRERNRKILLGTAVALVLLLGLLVWTKKPSAPADTGVSRATEGEAEALASGEAEASPRWSSPEVSTEPSTDTLGDAAAEESEGSDPDTGAAEATPEPASDVSAAAEDTRSAPRSRPRPPARKNDPDAPWIRR